MRCSAPVISKRYLVTALTNSRPWSLMVTSALPNLLKEMKYNIVYKSLVTYDMITMFFIPAHHPVKNRATSLADLFGKGSASGHYLYMNK